MELKSWRDLTDDPDHYVRTFRVFRDRCAEGVTLSGWLDGMFDEAVFGKLRVSLAGQDELRTLGVGSGSGELELPMLKMLLKQFPRIDNRVVEPNPKLLDQYKARVQSNAYELQGLNYDWRRQTIQQYEKAGGSTKFHFISAVHSLYYVDESALMDLYNSLEPGGIMLAIVRSDKSGHARLLHRLRQQLSLHQERYMFIDSSDIVGVLEQRGVPYTQYHRAQRWDITDCFDFDEATASGGERRLLVDFLTQAVDFEETAPEDVRRSVMEYLASSKCSERKGTTVLLKNDVSAVVINKPAGVLD